MPSLRAASRLLLILPALACGADTEGGGPSASTAAPDPVLAADEARRLVPPDAAMVLQVPSIDQFDRATAEFSQAIGLPGLFDMESLEELAGTSWWRRHADRFRPALIAFSPSSASGSMDRVSIIPVREAESAARDLRDASVHVDGRYVASSPDESYAPSAMPSPLAADLPPGHLSLRLDAQEVLAPIRPLVEMFTNMAIAQQAVVEVQGMDMAALYKAYQELLFDALDSTEIIEAGLSFKGGRAVLEGRVTMHDDSPLAHLPPADCSDLETIAACLDGEASGFGLFAFDTRSLVDGLTTFMLTAADTWPEADEEELYEYLAALRLLGGRSGHVYAGDVSFGTQGMTTTSIIGMAAGQDPATFTATLIDVMRQGLASTGNAFGLDPHIKEVTVGGLAGIEYSYDMPDLGLMLQPSGDPRADAMARRVMDLMLGPDGHMRYVAAARDGRVVMTGGAFADEDRILRDPTTVPAGLLEALTFVEGADARMVIRFDYARLLAPMADMMSEMEGLEDNPFAGLSPDDSLPLLIALGARGAAWDFRVSVDLNALRELTGR